MTPLVDIMLVLLIVFIETAPVMQHAVRVGLPHASNQPLDTRPVAVRLTVDANGAYCRNDESLSDAKLQHRLRDAAARTPQPELHIRGDQLARYERVAQAMAMAQRAGLQSLGFVMDPATR